ncbi:MAG: transglutaminaseTgpA domain-containing protein, partial [Bryobacteraceae bacterium]
ATVHLVFFLSSVLLLTAKTRRHYFLLALLAFLEILAACLLSINLNFFPCLTLFLISGVAAMVSGEIRGAAGTRATVARSGWRSLSWRMASVTLFAGAGILLMTAMLFFFLPRTARAAFQHLMSRQMFLPGFSNEVELGQIGRIQRSGATLMHVRFEERGPQPPMKWRGSALHEFDGRRWFNSQVAGQAVTVHQGRALLADSDQLRRRDGRRIMYDVHLKASVADTLFFTGVPEVLLIDAPLVIRQPSGGYRLGVALPQGARYTASSFLDSPGDAPPVATVETLPPRVLRLCLRLPPVDPRVAALARQITAGAPAGYPAARALEQHLAKQFSYTLDLPETESADPIAHFLLERRRGHCEYFASAMAVMLRTLGIPSRVVTGFYGGLFNPISGWHLIRASEAHSWVEAYLPGRGWTTFDPTPPDPAQRTLSLWQRLSLYSDAAETFWQDWVLGYDPERQATLADRMGQSGRTMTMEQIAAWWRRTARESSAIAAVIIVAFGTLAVAVAWYAFAGAWWRRWWTRRRQTRRLQLGQAESSDAALLYRRALDYLRRRGFEKPEWMTPAEFARVLPAEIGILTGEMTSV